MKTTILFALWAMALSLASGCVSNSNSNSPYRDPTEYRGGDTTKFTSYDFQQSAIAMVDSMLSNSGLELKIKKQFENTIPIVAIMPVANRTHHIIDLHIMEMAIESKLVNSGRFDLVDRKAENMLINEKTHDADSVLTSDAGVTNFGNLARADYLLKGELNEFRYSNGKVQDTYYQLTMKLLNKKTGKIDWSGEKEIRKVVTRPAVGW